jgi:hypothetical protein
MVARRLWVLADPVHTAWPSLLLSLHTSVTFSSRSLSDGLLSPPHADLVHYRRGMVGTFHGHGQGHEPGLLGLCVVRFWDPSSSFGEEFALLSVQRRFIWISFKIQPRHGGNCPLLPLPFPTLLPTFSPGRDRYSVGLCSNDWPNRCYLLQARTFSPGSPLRT